MYQALDGGGGGWVKKEKKEGGKKRRGDWGERKGTSSLSYIPPPPPPPPPPLSSRLPWWPLNRGDNNRGTLVGKAKKWPRPLDRGGRMKEVQFPILCYIQLFQDFVYWPLSWGSTIALLKEFSTNNPSNPYILIRNWLIWLGSLD